MTNKKNKLGWHGNMKTFYATLAAILVAATIIYGVTRIQYYYQVGRFDAEHHYSTNYGLCTGELWQSNLISPYVQEATDSDAKWLDQHSYSSILDKEWKTKGYNSGPVRKSLMRDSDLKACEQRAQVLRPDLHGTVTDKTGAIVSGATVEAVNLGTGVKYNTLANENGEYRFNNLPVGTYSVTGGRQSGVR